jgi:hypothetical protein
MLAGACEKYLPDPLPPAPYVNSPPGTVFRYMTFTNRVVSANGWVSRFVDDSGRMVNRIGGFISEDPAHPITMDQSKFAQLWPLKVGNEVTIPLSVGTELWSWHFKVTGEQLIDTPAGQFRTFVVEAVQTRLDTKRGPPPSYKYVLNYAPSVNAVARYLTTVLTGEDEGRSYGSELRGIHHPDESLNKR